MRLQLLLTLGATSLLALSSCSSVSKMDNLTHARDGFQRNVYASTGLGASRLTPDNSGISSWRITDKVNPGGQVTIGADINRHFSLELHSADLGSAGVEKFGGSERGRINYHMNGGSVLWYAGKNRHQNKRRGLTGYGRAGVAMMHNSPVGNAPYSQRNSTQMLVGAGLEYSTRIGLGLRAEAIAFDADAQYAQLGVIYRLGRKPETKPAPVFNVSVEKVEPLVPALALKVAPLDGDGDGVVDGLDQCKSTEAGAVVDADGCAIFDGVLEGVNFFSASARLTPKAKRILDGVVVTLKKYPRAKIEVNAHTDSVGTENYNQNLSERRADTVIRYLDSKGIKRQNLKAGAFGESKPVASNDNPQGRARNRRVELQASK